MASIINLWELPRRQALIKKVKESGENEGTYPLVFREKLMSIPIYRVPIGMPVYRLANGRTIARQREFIAKHSKPDVFFTRDPESKEAIEAQHEILSDLVQEQGLYNYFSNTNTVQDEPLILDENGYIINGNRRICAMRMLIQKDPVQFKKYEYVRVIFLQNYNEEDIIRLEAQLQIKRDIKADYSWITEAIMYQNHLNTPGFDYSALERLYEKKQSEIQELVDMAVYADEYLSSRGKKDEYSIVEKNEYVFKELRSRRKQLIDAQDKELFKELVFQFLDDPETAPGRLFRFVKDLADNLEDIKKTIKEEFEISETSIDTIPDTQTQKNYALLGSTESEPTEETNVNEARIEFVKSGEDAEELREAVVDTVALSKKKKRETKSKNAFKKNIQEAYTSLVDAKSLYMDSSVTDGVLQLIDNIEEIIEDIKGLIR